MSVLLQFTAAALALRLIKVSGGRTAWWVIAAAISLMAVRRGVVLWRLLADNLGHRLDPAVELGTLGVSLLLVAGIASIGPLFTRLTDSEQTLKQERDFIAGVADTVGALVVVLDREGRIVRFNRQCEQTTGYASEEVEGQPFWDPFLVPEEIEPVKAVFAQLTAGDFPGQHENYWLTKDGRRRLIAWSNTALVGADGNVEHVIATGIDVTEHRAADEALLQASEELERRVERRTAELSAANERLTREVAERQRAEEALRDSQTALQRSNEELERVLNTIGDGVMVLDSGHRLVRANRRICELLQYTEAELRGKDPSFWTHPESLSRMGQELEKRQRGEVSAYEAKYVRKDGSFFHGLATGVAILDAQGKPAGAVGCIKDISDRKRAEQQLAEQAEELARSNAELEQFAYVASHDLQEPLRKVRAFGDRLNAKFGGLLPEQGRDYLARMVNASERMQTLINDLLQYSRVTTKAQPFAPVDLNEIARQVVSDLELQVERQHGRIEVGSLPTIDADHTQLRQVLQNLIGNALKFRRQTEDPVVQVRGEVVPAGEMASGESAQSAELLQLTVEDNGIGFDRKHAERIFGVFQRLHGRDAYEGTGMGLAICRKIAERHGGSLTADSAPGKGTTFTLTLPVEQPEGIGEKFEN
jgi:PAS domain S-box-containing protein